MFTWFKNRRRKKIIAQPWPEAWSLHLNRNDGDFKSAISITKKAIEMATAKGDDQMADLMSKRLELLNSEKPVRE